MSLMITTGNHSHDPVPHLLLRVLPSPQRLPLSNISLLDATLQRLLSRLAFSNVILLPTTINTNTHTHTHGPCEANDHNEHVIELHRSWIVILNKSTETEPSLVELALVLRGELRSYGVPRFRVLETGR